MESLFKKLRREKPHGGLAPAAFFVGCLLMLAVYAALGWWPFGTGTVLTGDLRGLYVNYITDLWARSARSTAFFVPQKIDRPPAAML